MLGSCLLDGDAMLQVELEPADFYLTRHGDIWRLMQSIHANGRRIDYLTVVSSLEDGKLLDSIGGSGYIAELITATPTAAHIEDYAHMVRDCAERRHMIASAMEMYGQAHDMTRDLDGIRQAAIVGIVGNARGSHTAQPIGVFAGGVAEEIEAARANPQHIYGVETGFADLDAQTHGFQRGEVVLLAGQPGIGKSILSWQIGMQAGERGYSVLGYALEMKALSTARRIVSAHARVRTDGMRAGTLTDEQYQDVLHAIGHVSELPIFISDYTGWTTTGIRSDVARHLTRHPVDLVIVDYLKLLRDWHADKLERDNLISKGLHSIAKDLNVAVLAVHTLNKVGIRNGAISLADAGGSVDIIYDADVAMFLTDHIPEHGRASEEHVATITFQKFREDGVDKYLHLTRGSVQVGGWRKDLPRFENYQRGYA